MRLILPEGAHCQKRRKSDDQPEQITLTFKISYDPEMPPRLRSSHGHSGKHPDAGFANAGEKAFFWCFTIFGLILMVTGLMMLYPETFGDPSKNSLQLALILHIVSAIILSAFSVVHIYMGAVMSEGGMENMLSGKCDENWARQNHNLWYAKVSGK